MGTHANIRVIDEDTVVGVSISSDGHRAGDDILDVSMHWKNKVNDDDPAPAPGTAREWVDAFIERRSRSGFGPGASPVDHVEPFTAEWHYDVSIANGQVESISAYERLCGLGAVGAGRRDRVAETIGSHRLKYHTVLGHTGDWTDGCISGNG